MNKAEKLPDMLYHFTHWDYGLDAIKDERLKLCLIDQANDPNEFLGYYSSNKETRRFIQSAKNLLGKKYGIICLSGKCNNSTMWGHYTDNHKGICLGFSHNDRGETIGKVNYSNRKIRLTKDDVESLDTNEVKLSNLFLEFLYQKSDDWKYENEYRIFEDLYSNAYWSIEKDMFFMNYKKDLILKEVVLGIRSPKDTAYIYRFLKHHKYIGEVTIRKLGISEHSYDLEEVESERIKYSP